MMHVLGIDLQQVSIASLIIALGLLVDDPVVAGDAIKRDLAAGQPRVVAAWLGPTKLATAIMFATITNIVAYLPFLMLPGDTGQVPLQPADRHRLLAGRVAHRLDDVHPAARLLPAAAEGGAADRGAAHDRASPRSYYRVGELGDRASLGRALRRRWRSRARRRASSRSSKTQFFPKDLSVSLVRRRLAAGGRAALGDQRDRARGRSASSARWPTSTPRRIRGATASRARC